MKLISIHAAREGGDLIIFFLLFKYTLFQSTPPVKAATPYRFLCWENCWISIHAAREGGDADSGVVRALRMISIHAAREGGDVACRQYSRERVNFNPRRP